MLLLATVCTQVSAPTGLNVERIMKMIVMHDLAECVPSAKLRDADMQSRAKVGDITPQDNVSKTEKRRQELVRRSPKGPP